LRTIYDRISLFQNKKGPSLKLLGQPRFFWGLQMQLPGPLPCYEAKSSR
jgi:hypothetical protein